MKKLSIIRRVTKGQAKKTKTANPLVLNAEVGLYKPGRGTTQLGKIIEVGRYLLTVEWEDKTTEQFGKTGKSFYGKVDESGELVPPKHDPMWGGDEDHPYLTVATESMKESIAAKRAEKQKRDEERRQERERIESDPVYQKRQADLKRFSELLQGLGHVETSWNKRENFRIELEDIAPEQMENLIAVIAAIRKVRG